ncbi:MAG: outer membrane protein assembly factor BamD [Candidatus Humimicrobiaceae bacterium]
MYTYKRRNKVGPGSIVFATLFVLAIIGLSYLFYTDKGLFWDLLPLASITIVVLSIIFAIFNFVRRNYIGFLFIIFFIIFIGGIIISSLFGPFSLNYRGNRNFEQGDYRQAIDDYGGIVNNYPTSRYFDNALENLAYAYYKTGDCNNTIESLNRALELGIISQNLEVKKMFVDCYQKLANRHIENNNYQLSAMYFLKAVNVYSQIKDQYPDADAAFIAEYKMPELTYKAAINYKQDLNWDKAIGLFKDITSKYPNSEYAEKAGLLLFNSYINKSLEHKNKGEYAESISEFLKILDLGTNEEASFKITHYKDVILSAIPIAYLDKQAFALLAEKEYKKASFLFESIIEFHPDFRETYGEYLAESKISHILESNYKNLSIAQKEDIYVKEKSILVVENSTILTLYLYIIGNTELAAEIGPNSVLEFELVPGSYKVAADFSSATQTPLFGNLSFEEGTKNIITVKNLPY